MTFALNVKILIKKKEKAHKLVRENVEKSEIFVLPGVESPSKVTQAEPQESSMQTTDAPIGILPEDTDLMFFFKV